MKVITPPTHEMTYVPIKFIRSLLRFAQQQGVDVSLLLQSAGVTFDPSLSDEKSDDNHRVSAIEYSLIYQQLFKQLKRQFQAQQDPATIPVEFDPAAFKMMCYAIIHCRTLGKAMHRLCDFIALFYPKVAHLSFSVNHGHARLEYPYFSLSQPVEQWVGDNIVGDELGEVYALTFWHRFLSWLVARPVELSAVYLQSDKRGNINKLEALFGVSAIHFGSEVNSLVFNASCLELPVLQDEQGVKNFLRTAPYAMMMVKDEEHSDLHHQVRKAMKYHPRYGFQGIEHVAKSLNMSAPTLRRKLRQEGLSYQSIKDKYRQEMAVSYLNRPELSITAIAMLMHYVDTSTFYRSFKRWTGYTPSDYRRQVLGQTPDEATN